MAVDGKLTKKLQAENDELRMRLGEAEETLRAIRSGEVDALVVSGPEGERIFTLEGAEHPYRVLVESMNEGAVTLDDAGAILYSNSRLAEMLQIPLERIIGTPFSSFVAPSDRVAFAALVEKCQERACKGKIALINGEEGYTLAVQISCNTQEIAGNRGASIVISDLTELTVYQLELEAQLHELLEARHELESSRDLYSNLYDFAPVGYFTLDRKGTIHNVNFAGAEILGVERSWLNGRRFEHLVTDAARPAFSAFLGKVFASPAKEACEVELLKKGDSSLYVQIEAVAADSGEECRIALIDISERKRIEELQRYRSIVEDLTEIICKTEPDGTLTFVNDVYCRLFGKTREELVGSTWHPDVFPDDLPIIEEQLRTLSPANPVVIVENRVYSGSGEVRWMQFVNRGVFEKAGRLIEIQAVGRDITKRKEAENALRTSDERLSLALAAARMGVWEWNVKTSALIWSPEVHKIFGVKDFTETVESFTNALHPDDADRVMAAARQALADKTDFTLEYRIIRPDGQVRWVSDLARPICDEKGNPLRMIGTVHDITERKLAEERLLRSERLLAEAQRIAHLGSWHWDSKSATINGSDEFYRIFGSFFSSYDEFIERVHPDDRKKVNKATQGTLDRQSSFDINHRIVRPDGTIRVIQCRGEAEIGGDDKQVRIIGTVQDITERRQIEEQLEIMHNNLIARAAELETANVELDAFNHSVSHDLRRPLTVINSYCQVLQEVCGDRLEDECKGYIRNIYEYTLQMNRFIDAMLVFSHVTRSEMQLAKVDLSKLAEDVAIDLKIAEPLHRVTFRIAAGITADGDAALLRVVLDNLIGNSWKYAGKQEETVIEFGIRDVDGKPVCYVRDNGPGFDMAFADKLFIPFQRLPGTNAEGHGIGLATVDRIVRRHGGRVWAESEPGNGATFYFTLPGGCDDAAGRRP